MRNLPKIILGGAYAKKITSRELAVLVSTSTTATEATTLATAN